MFCGVRVLSLVFVVVCAGHIHALTEEDIASFTEAMSPSVAACSEEHGVSQEKYTEGRKTGSTEGVEPCFFSCLLKKLEIMDSKGMYDAEKSLEFGATHVKSDTGMEIYTMISNHCAKVNDIDDGEEGCERAKQFFDCVDEQKQEHN